MTMSVVDLRFSPTGTNEEAAAPLLSVEERLAAAEAEVVRLRQRLLAQTWRLGEERRSHARSEDLRAQLELARTQARAAVERLAAERAAHLERTVAMERACANERELREAFHAAMASELARAHATYIAQLRSRSDNERAEWARERDEWRAERERLSARADANAEHVFARIARGVSAIGGKRARAALEPSSA
jgi:hypothetical protein